MAFSPDSQWLAVISHANKVKLFSTRQNDQGGLSESFVEVGRIDRAGDARLRGSLGQYWRTINRIQFSPDGQMLVASDISGHLDCWTVADASPQVNGNAKHGHTNSDDDSDDDSELSDAGARIDGWEWRRSEAAESLPQLDATPIVLSFRPQTGPKDGYRLMVLTAKHSIFELSLSDGSFTDWSRRNPTQVLPQKFARILDRAMGSFWGADGWWWIYGTSWVFGMDTAVDHEGDESEDGGRKRKREQESSSAGSAVKRRDQVALVRADDGDEETTPPAPRVDKKTASERNERKWFLTFRYQPILGIVPIASRKDGPVQVALIERPVYELNLPPRFESVHRGR